MTTSDSLYLAHHFDDREQQREAMTLGMWVFLVTEIMFFGGMFLAYAVYRWRFPEGFAEGLSSEEKALLKEISRDIEKRQERIPAQQ